MATRRRPDREERNEKTFNPEFRDAFKRIQLANAHWQSDSVKESTSVAAHTNKAGARMRQDGSYKLKALPGNAIMFNKT
jgi:hypothetical protein